jgi:hypothetical protein
VALSSRLPQVIDALVSLARALPGHRDPESETVTSGVPVFDGPSYGITSDRAVTWIAVGWSGDPDAPEDAGGAMQVTAALGDKQRDEAGSIRVRVVSQTGDRRGAAMKTCRDAAFAEMALIEGLCRSTPRLGLSPTWMAKSQVDNRYTYRQEIIAGPVFTLTFEVGFVARI